MTERDADLIMEHVEYMTVWAMEEQWAPSARRQDYVRMLDHLYQLHKLRDRDLFLDLVHYDHEKCVCCWSDADRRKLKEMQCG